MASEEEDGVIEVQIGKENLNIEKAAPGRAFEALLQCNEYDEDEIVASGNHKPSLTSQSSIIAELEAETADANHTVNLRSQLHIF